MRLTYEPAPEPLHNPRTSQIESTAVECDAACRAQGAACRVKGLGFRVQELVFIAHNRQRPRHDGHLLQGYLAQKKLPSPLGPP